jgi:hypothetical protein
MGVGDGPGVRRVSVGRAKDGTGEYVGVGEGVSVGVEVGVCTRGALRVGEGGSVGVRVCMGVGWIATAVHWTGVDVAGFWLGTTEADQGGVQAGITTAATIRATVNDVPIPSPASRLISPPS